MREGSNTYTSDYVRNPHTNRMKLRFFRLSGLQFVLQWKNKNKTHDLQCRSISKWKLPLSRPLCNSQSCVPQTLQLRRGILIVSICNADFYLGFRKPKEIRLSALPMLPPTLSAAYRTTGYSHVERQRSNPELNSHVRLTEWKLPDK